MLCSVQVILGHLGVFFDTKTVISHAPLGFRRCHWDMVEVEGRRILTVFIFILGGSRSLEPCGALTGSGAWSLEFYGAFGSSGAWGLEP